MLRTGQCTSRTGQHPARTGQHLPRTGQHLSASDLDRSVFPGIFFQLLTMFIFTLKIAFVWWYSLCLLYFKTFRTVVRAEVETEQEPAMCTLIGVLTLPSVILPCIKFGVMESFEWISWPQLQTFLKKQINNTNIIVSLCYQFKRKREKALEGKGDSEFSGMGVIKAHCEDSLILWLCFAILWLK